ncbi:MAG TPA: LytR C-terminal domain-containing protein [Acidimicrobiales bacterium]|nr:LytR C-terminal domain-containing protein [Acidimicrobiales bacterium]
MKPGRYAASDGSFARSAGGAGARGLLLLAIALLIGVVLLNATDADPPGTSVSAEGDSDSGDGGAGTDDGDDGGGGDAAAASTTTAAPTTTLPARAPGEVKVIVANASEVKGAAGGGRTALVNAKYNVLAPTNATPTPTSSVFFVPGYDRDAAGVAAALQLPANLVKPMPAPLPFDTKGANVAVVLGADHAAKFGTAPATGATTTTTAAGAAGATTTTAAAGATTTTRKP